MTSRTPVRTCVGCRAEAGQTELVRVALDPSTDPPSVVWDRHRRRPGRGAWVHPAPECLQLALRRRAFHRAFRGPVDAERLAEAGRAPDAGPRGAAEVCETAPAARPTDEGGSEI